MYMLIDIFHINIHAAKSYNILKESEHIMHKVYWGYDQERMKGKERTCYVYLTVISKKKVRPAAALKMQFLSFNNKQLPSPSMLNRGDLGGQPWHIFR